MAACAKKYTNAVFEKSGCIKKCIAGIDGTVIETACLGGHGIPKRVMYTGQKCKDALMAQCVTPPDGLCIHIQGLELGRF